MSIYDIQQAVDDGATVPIYYESRLAKIDLNLPELPQVDEDVEDILDSETADERASQMVEEQEEEVIEQPTNTAATVFYFEFDKAILSSDTRASLIEHAQFMKSYPSNIRLEGHADERGTREYNMALGERRANSVKEFMVLQGVPSSMIEVISYGEERAASFGSNSAAWSMNRRVELK